MPVARAVCCCLLLSAAVCAIGQDIPEGKIMHYEALSPDTGSCAYATGIANDTLAAAFRKAMTYYPELCNRKIQVQYGHIATSMAARPRILSVFRKRDRRVYRVIVNGDLRKAQARLIYAAPFNARVGVMGHELAHILDYSTKSGWQMMWTGIRYTGRKYRRKMERQTDSVAVARGLGWQLYHYAWFVVYAADVDASYRQYKLDTYMKPEEILNQIIE